MGQIIPNLVYPPRSITADKQDATLPTMDGRGHTGEDSPTLMRIEKPLALLSRVVLQVKKYSEQRYLGLDLEKVIKNNKRIDDSERVQD